MAGPLEAVRVLDLTTMVRVPSRPGCWPIREQTYQDPNRRVVT